jgi:hypothetical protein
MLVVQEEEHEDRQGGECSVGKVEDASRLVGQHQTGRRQAIGRARRDANDDERQERGKHEPRAP